MYITRKSGDGGIDFSMVSVEIHTQRSEYAAFADVKVVASPAYEDIDEVTVNATHTLIGLDGFPVI